MGLVVAGDVFGGKAKLFTQIDAIVFGQFPHIIVVFGLCRGGWQVTTGRIVLTYLKLNVGVGVTVCAPLWSCASTPTSNIIWESFNNRHFIINVETDESRHTGLLFWTVPMVAIFVWFNIAWSINVAP